ncbi:MAG: hypothetical protein SO176_00060 [Bacilli bacterium]|nr:hypothetical protein [Bacilli bacterium]
MENVKINQTKPQNRIFKWGSVFGFLGLEILCFVSFYLGHSFILYSCFFAALVLLFVVIFFKELKLEGFSSFAFFLFPLFIFGLLTALSTYTSHSIGKIGVVEGAFIPIGLSFAALAGYLLSNIQNFKIKNVLLVIYASLGAFVLINLLITMIYFVPFYTIIYRNSYIFYDGKPSSVPIGRMAYMLFGLSISEVSIEYFTLFPSVLLTSVIPLFFLKYRQNKREFLIYLVCSIIAGITLLFTITKWTLITDIILIIGIVIIICAGKYTKFAKIMNKVMTVAFIVLFLVILLMFFNSQSWSFVTPIRNVIANNSLLNRVFNTNRYSVNINAILNDLFVSWKLFGVPIGYESFEYANFVSQEVSNVWLFDNLLASGIFGSIFFLLAIIVGVRYLFKYFVVSDDQLPYKMGIFGYVLGFLVISLLVYDNRPLINSSALSPIFTSSMMLITIFLLGFVFKKSQVADTKENITSKVEKEEIYHESI